MPPSVPHWERGSTRIKRSFTAPEWIASQLPPKFLRHFKRSCKICLAMKKRRPRRPKALSPQDKASLAPWEMVQADSSGRFKVVSKLGNRYYTAFTCMLTGVRVVIPHAKRKHFPLVYLKFAQRIQRHPRILYSDMGGENLGKAIGSLASQRGASLACTER